MAVFDGSLCMLVLKRGTLNFEQVSGAAGAERQAGKHVSLLVPY